MAILLEIVANWLAVGAMDKAHRRNFWLWMIMMLAGLAIIVYFVVVV